MAANSFYRAGHFVAAGLTVACFGLAGCAEMNETLNQRLGLGSAENAEDNTGQVVIEGEDETVLDQAETAAGEKVDRVNNRVDAAGKKADDQMNEKIDGAFDKLDSKIDSLFD